MIAREAQLEADAHEALREHLLRTARFGRQRHPSIRSLEDTQSLLADRDVVRYPVEVVFDAASLQSGEFAYADMVGDRPDAGYRLSIHPQFQGHATALPLLIAYHIPTINFGPIVTADESEVFGAELLGLDQEAYYTRLCALADSIPT
ncbi:MAG: hypothetical protein QF561_05150 [Phycisphaerales bacterium]|jgi:hypothetical protein|nr:hypothetical protein [Phycisphaerales bacterium]